MSEHTSTPIETNGAVKYQVFISSTYQDLKEERMLVLRSTLMAGCIPAGMEYFVATDDEQFNIIKQVIDLCDIYVLIIGNRYGTVHPITGISFTEMEYDYAKAKGIDVLVFALDENIDNDKYERETDPDNIEKLHIFRDKAMQGRLASVWRDKSDLAIRVTNSIRDAILRCNRPGWIRGDAPTRDAVIEENKQLRKKISDLETKIAESIAPPDFDKEFYGKEIQLRYIQDVLMDYKEETLSTTLDDLFKNISVHMLTPTFKEKVIEAIGSYCHAEHVNEKDALGVLLKYTHLKLIKSIKYTNGKEYINLTPLGEKISYNLI